MSRPCPVCGRVEACRCYVPKAAAPHPAVSHLLQFFSFEHLPEPLRSVSHRFHDLAHEMVAELPGNPELAVALRKLLEAKDCAVRTLVAARAADERPGPKPPPRPRSDNPVG